LKTVAIGARVLLTANMDLTQGACNGAFATVSNIDFSEQGVPDVIHVVMDSTGITVKVRSDNRRTCWHNHKHYSKTCFPLALAYAITIHKSQGATFRNLTIIHMRSGFAPGLAYVAFSRVPAYQDMPICELWITLPQICLYQC
jgi:ATP-dependent exoDNAse (exonuclease V) alpha subunit